MFFWVLGFFRRFLRSSFLFWVRRLLDSVRMFFFLRFMIFGKFHGRFFTPSRRFIRWFWVNGISQIVSLKTKMNINSTVFVFFHFSKLWFSVVSYGFQQFEKWKKNTFFKKKVCFRINVRNVCVEKFDRKKEMECSNSFHFRINNIFREEKGSFYFILPSSRIFTKNHFFSKNFTFRWFLAFDLFFDKTLIFSNGSKGDRQNSLNRRSQTTETKKTKEK